MISQQESYWRGDFGDAYVDRNRIDWRLRIPFWRGIIEATKPSWLLEVGCNIGSNLKAIEAVDHAILARGVDVNEKALWECQQDNLLVRQMSAKAIGRSYPGDFDLVFTAGVLIHIPPVELDEVIDAIIMASRRYVLAIEYSSDVEQIIQYRGLDDALWKRPYGDIYSGKGLSLVQDGDAGDGFDNCHYWLFEKQV